MLESLSLLANKIELCMSLYHKEIMGSLYAAGGVATVYVAKQIGAFLWRRVVAMCRPRPLGVEVETLLEAIDESTLVEVEHGCACPCKGCYLQTGCDCDTCLCGCVPGETFLLSGGTRVYADGRVTLSVTKHNTTTCVDVPYSDRETKRIAAAYAARAKAIRAEVAESLRDAAATGNQPISVENYIRGK